MGKITFIMFSVILITLVCGNTVAESEARENIQSYYGFSEIEIIKLGWDISNLCLADFNGDGLTDIAVVNNRKSKIEFLIQKRDPNRAEPVDIQPDDDINEIIYSGRFSRQELLLSAKAANLVFGDLNSDGSIDLAFYGKPNALYVILQKKPAQAAEQTSGLLGWQRRQKIKIDDGVLNSKAIACDDLNGDGKDDIVLAGNKSVYLIAQKEDGLLAEAIKYPVTAQVLGLDTGDLNGDGRSDLVLITNDSGKPLSVRFGLENGELSPQRQFFIEEPSDIKLFDYDGDGADEIFIVENLTGRLVCYKFSGESQQPEQEYPIVFYPLESNRESVRRDLVLGDFDGNGLFDIVISEPGSAEVILYKQMPGVGLTEPVRFPAFSDIVSLSARDIDGDDRYELAVLSIDEKAIGVSKFKDNRFTFPKPVNLEDSPLAMEFCDIDGDAKTDCLYIARDSNNVVYLGSIYKISLDDDNARGLRLVELKELESNPEGIKAVDIDQDGLMDVMVFVSKYDAPIVVRQTRKGKFEVVDSPASQASLIKNATTSSIYVADVDGKEGKELLIAQRNFARSLVFSDGIKWNVVDQYNAKSTENEISAVAAFDLDDDGVCEILLLDGRKGQLQILKTGEDKTYRLDKELEISQWDIKKIGFSQLCGGGVKSILLFDGDKFALISPGKKNMGLEKVFSYETKIRNGRYGRLVVGDINSDEQADIVMIEHLRDHVEILALDNERKPVPAMRFKVFEEKSYQKKQGRGSGRVEPRYLGIADVTGDGRNDLIAVIHDRIIVYPQDF